MTISSRVVSRNLFFKAIVCMVPNHGKRLLLLSSFIACAYNKDHPEQAFVRNINDVLKLAKSGQRSLELPMHVNKLIWNGREIILSEIEALKGTDNELKRKAAFKVASIVPSWMAYGTVDEIAQDLMVYFTSPHPTFAI